MLRPVTKWVSKLCDIQFYVKAEPYTDPHFRPEPDFIVDNAYFDSEAEAEALKKKWEENHFFGQLTVCKRITELE